MPGKLAIYVQPQNQIDLPINALQILSSGNVGFGTTSPAEKVHINGIIALTDQTTPSTPAAGIHKIYSKSDGIYVLDSSGSEIGPISGGATELDDLTDVDLTTPPTDGQVLTYDDDSETWRAGTIAAGAALTVKEADGTPTVSDVDTIVVTNGTLTDDGSGQVTLDLSAAATDTDAIHDNQAGEIAALTEKATPVSADLLIIEDSAASYGKKKVQIGNLPGGGLARCKVTRTTPQSIPNNAVTAVTFTSEVFDTAGMFPGSGTEVTIPADGLYLVLAQALFAPNATGTRQASVKRVGGIMSRS